MSESHPSPSALQSLLNTHQLPAGTEPSHHHLALQVAHNLRNQHNWTNLRLHTHQSPTLHNPTHPADLRNTPPRQRLPRPLISGLPPKRLYVHPDEQLALLQKEKREGRKPGELLGVRSEREWVLPSHLRERWSLSRFGEVFDGIGAVPADGEGDEVFRMGTGGQAEGAGSGDEDLEGEGAVSQWRMKMPKRLLLATLDDDSTIVYYIVHDGIVKPRQN